MSEQRFYIVLVEDHGFETLSYLFSNKESARDKAREIAQNFASSYVDYFYEETDYTEESNRIEFPPGEWLFYAENTEKGSSVKVVPVILDAKQICCHPA